MRWVISLYTCSALRFFPGVPAPTLVRGYVCSLCSSCESFPRTQVLRLEQRLDMDLPTLLEKRYTQLTVTEQIMQNTFQFSYNEEPDAYQTKHAFSLSTITSCSYALL